MITETLKNNTLFVSSTLDGPDGMEEVKAELNAFVLASGLRFDINTIQNQVKDGGMYWYFRLWGRALTAYKNFKAVRKIEGTYAGIDHKLNTGGK